MRRRAVFGVAVIVAAAAGQARAPAASASCASAVVVDGRVLFGTAMRASPRLPPRAGTYPALSPACGDTGDRPTTVVRLQGVPPHVAVVDRAGDTLYHVDGSLLAIGTHPLHGALFEGRREPRQDCRPYRTDLRGRVIDEGTLAIRTGARTVRVGVDATTRFTNRPVYEPVLAGQRLALETSRCGSRRVADRVTFLGPAPATTPYRPRDGALVSGWPELEDWQWALLVFMASAAALIGVLWWTLGRAGR